MNDKGLTLIELLITMTIVAVLASIVIPLSEMSVKREKELELKRSLRTIRMAIDDYKKAWDEGRIKRNLKDSGYPPDLQTLVDGVDDAKNPQFGGKIRFLRRIPRDPMDQNTSADPADTWGKRSYASPPDDPKEGDDVYDVYSKSEATAIDGTAYKTW